MGKKKIAVGIAMAISYIFIMIIWLMSVGSDCVASYETHVVVGLGAFLIVENLTIPFFLNVFIFVGGAIILLYDVIKNKKKCQ